jgi:hypothetical protein
MKFTPSPGELALVSQIMAKVDPYKIGILTCDAALKVFHGSKLSPSVLGEIWNISAEGNNGWISREGLAIAVRLVGWAQKGEKITQALVDRRECVCNHAICISFLKVLPCNLKLDLFLQSKAFRCLFHTRTQEYCNSPRLLHRLQYCCQC